MRRKPALLAGGITREAVARFPRARLAAGRLATAVAVAVTLLCATAHGDQALAATTQSTSTVCSPIYSVGHKSSTGTETWSHIDITGNGDILEFESSGTRASMCSAVGYRGVFIEWDGGCLEPVTNYAGEVLVSVQYCDGSAGQEWYTDQVDISANPYDVALRNVGTGQCMYQDAQLSAIMTGCGAEYTDHFEWFYWTSA